MHFTELELLGIGSAADVASVMPDFRVLLADPAQRIDYLNFGGHYVQLGEDHSLSSMIS